MEVANSLMEMFKQTNFSYLLEDQRIQHLLPSILSNGVRLPKGLQSVLYGETATARSGYGCNDAFSVFAFLAFLLALLQLMQDMGGGGRRFKRETEECPKEPDNEDNRRMKEGTLAAYSMFTGSQLDFDM